MPAAYCARVREFLDSRPEEILGILHSAAAREGFARQWADQTRAWEFEVKLLRESLSTATVGAENSSSSVLLEYSIPRRSRRIDAVLLLGGAVVIIEFKVGARVFTSAAKWQVTEYARDTRDFHLASRGRVIVPLLVATEAPESGDVPCLKAGVGDVVAIAATELGRVVRTVAEAAKISGLGEISAAEWNASPYRPALNLVQAVEAIFAGHEVREIAHAAADDVQLTVERLHRLVDEAEATKRRIACFVTGGPGSGKTLVGVRLAADARLRSGERPPSAFLSGNGPLIKVMRALLARDARRRTGSDLKETARTLRYLVQPVHEFVKSSDPGERIVIFDEAQRAWGQEQMHKEHDEPALQRSEPEVILDLLEQKWDWCVLVALVGGGQEINKGEDGLLTWGDALVNRATWTVVAAPSALNGDASLAGQRLFRGDPPRGMRVVPELHLTTSMRVFRAKIVADWVNAVLDGRPADAAALLHRASEFPIVLTRSLDRARLWLCEKMLDRTEPSAVGLLASSNALRLRADGLEIDSAFRRSFFDDSKWFLESPEHIKSAYRLEVAATEFECQGLELDWTAVCWEGDLSWDSGAWSRRRFRGSNWEQVRDPIAQQFVMNRYRVLLTRARQGTVIYVPRGSPSDVTRDPRLFDATAEFLARCGVRPID